MALDIDEAKRWAVSAYQSKDNTAYHKYRKYLVGDHDLAYATDKFREAFGTIFKAFSYNLCETVVDAHADRMEITGFGADNEDIQQAAQDVWDANGMDAREGQVEADQFGYGDGYVIVDVVDSVPVIWPAVPTEMRVRYSDQTPGKVIAASRLWGEGKVWRLNVWTEATLTKYQANRSTDSTDAPTKPEAFAPIDGDNDFPNPVEGIVPVFHFANNARVNDYGVSELRSVIPLQNGLNKTVMDMLVAMEFAAFPQRVAIGIDDEDPDTQSAIRDLVTGVNRLITLQGTPDGGTPSIAEFSAANIAQYIDVINQFEKKIALVSKVPRNYFGERTADAISGESKRMDESGFISKIEDRQKYNGQRWAEMVRYCLLTMGMAVQPGDIRTNWKPAAPLSDAEELQLALNRKALGFPFKSNLRELSYEPDQLTEIVEDKAEEDAAAVDRQRSMFDAGFVPSGVGE